MNSLHSIWYHWVPRFKMSLNVDPGQESQPAKRSPAWASSSWKKMGIYQNFARSLNVTYAQITHVLRIVK